MKKNIFAQEIAKIVEEKIGNEVEVRECAKVNGVKFTGLAVKDMGRVTPIIYIDSFYEEYEDGEVCLPEVADRVVEIYNQNKVDDGDELGREMSSLILDWERAKEHIVVSVRNADMNKELLEEVPHSQIGDLAVMYRINLDVEPRTMKGVCSVLVTNAFKEHWGDLAFASLDKTAWENTRNIRPYKVNGMLDVLMGMSGGELPDEIAEAAGDPMGMHILSNAEGIDGACYILDGKTLDEVMERLGWENGLYIIPSSIHEAILLPYKSDIEPDFIMGMIGEVNAAEVQPEEVLSYKLYRYVDGELGAYNGEWSDFSIAV